MGVGTVRKKKRKSAFSGIAEIFQYVIRRSNLWVGFILALGVFHVSWYLKPEHPFIALMGWIFSISLFGIYVLLALLIPSRKKNKRE
jgi:hypothetical protein